VILFGTCNVERHVDQGKFVCPRCSVSTPYALIRAHEYLPVYFIPILQQRIVAEQLRCLAGNHRFPLTALATTGPLISSQLELFRERTQPTTTSVGNVVTFTLAAVDELKRRHTTGQFSSDAVVRVSPEELDGKGYLVAFDYAEADGRDWIGESHGIPIVVDRSEAHLLVGKTIDFREGHFCNAI
jgi:Fe-S cluster assembly iron-binding protein IscA